MNTIHRFVQEISEGSKILEDQLRLMDEKYLELRQKLGVARNQFVTALNKAHKEAKTLRKKYAYANGGKLLDTVNTERYEQQMLQREQERQQMRDQFPSLRIQTSTPFFTGSTDSARLASAQNSARGGRATIMPTKTNSQQPLNSVSTDSFGGALGGNVNLPKNRRASTGDAPINSVSSSVRFSSKMDQDGGTNSYNNSNSGTPHGILNRPHTTGTFRGAVPNIQSGGESPQWGHSNGQSPAQTMHTRLTNSGSANNVSEAGTPMSRPRTANNAMSSSSNSSSDNNLSVDHIMDKIQRKQKSQRDGRWNDETVKNLLNR